MRRESRSDDGSRVILEPDRQAPLAKHGREYTPALAPVSPSTLAAQVPLTLVMERSRFVGRTASVLALTCIPLACERAAGPAEAPQATALEPAADPLGDLTQVSRADAERALEAQLDDLHDSLDDWIQSARRQGVEGQAKIVAELQRREAELRDELEALRQSGAEAWREICRATQQEIAKLAEQFRQVFDSR